MRGGLPGEIGMTRVTVHFVLIDLLLLAAAGCSREAPRTPPAPSTSAPGTIVAVDDLMNSPEKYPGVLRVEGVVSEISEKDHTLGLIDIREFRECGGIECAELVLPVRWNGQLPSPADAVRVEGRIVESGGKSVFEATSIEKITLPPEGLK